MKLHIFSRDLKITTLTSLRNIKDHRVEIERLEPTKLLVTSSIEFDADCGICYNLVALCTQVEDMESITELLKSIFKQLGLNHYLPVPDEFYGALGNMWNTTNPTHNAKGRWELVDILIDILEKDLSNV